MKQSKIGMLRQWLNEERIDDPKKMVTNEQIALWLEDEVTKEYCKLHSFTGTEADSEACSECNPKDNVDSIKITTSNVLTLPVESEPKDTAGDWELKLLKEKLKKGVPALDKFEIAFILNLFTTQQKDFEARLEALAKEVENGVEASHSENGATTDEDDSLKLMQVGINIGLKDSAAIIRSSVEPKKINGNQ